MKVAFICLPEPGHVNATLRLCFELEELGHDVRYVSSSEQTVNVFLDRGLKVVRPQFSKDAAGNPLVTAPIGLEGFEPDVALIDAVYPEATILAWRQGMSVLRLSTTFSTRYNPSLPPVSSTLCPTEDPKDAAAFEQAWACEYDQNVRGPWLTGIVELAAELGFPRQYVDDRSALGITCRVPELVLAPRELEFAHPAQADQAFAGPCVHLERRETGGGSIAYPNDGEPLIYCAFGTQHSRYSDAREWLDLVLGAARQCEELHFVISADPALCGELTPNVRVFPFVPQLEVLRRARLMLSHGGLNSVKEALCCGVPLCILPFDMDQPGNAARISHHGYGYGVPWKDTSREALAEILRRAVRDVAMRERTQALGARLRAALEERHAARAFTALSASALARAR